MARRKIAWTPQKVRQRIRVGVLLQRLQKHALGEIDMTKTQIVAALGLLKKTVPDLSSIEHTGEIRHRDVSDEPLTADQWQEQYANHLAAPVRPPEGTH